MTAVLGGLVVFGRKTPWSVAGLWPLLAGPAVAMGYFLGLSGQMEAGSKLCGAPANGSCDTAWGLGAVLIAIMAAVALGGVFTGAFALRRLSHRIHRPATTT